MNDLLLEALLAYAATCARGPDGLPTPAAQEDMRRIAALADDPEAMQELAETAKADGQGRGE